MDIENMTFEQGMQALEEIVRRLESGETTLEESFETFERGMAIQAKLKALLDSGDKRIRVLTENGVQSMDEEA
ncbi:MAG: exodeoxyribonuclease VII small subunit [Eubacteriales bacterium]|nr:exodeoxyribonuclease VII small subunit [Eubacteriales bacterium]